MASKALIVAVLVAAAIGSGFAVWEYRQTQSPGAPSSTPKVLLSKSSSLTYTPGIQDPYNPTHSAYWNLELNTGQNIRITVHTTNTIYVYVTRTNCIPTPSTSCTVFQIGFTPSEDPPNVSNFVVAQDGPYRVSISLFQVGSLLPGSPSSASVQIVVEALS